MIKCNADADLTRPAGTNANADIDKNGLPAESLYCLV